jgi:hypothetical protein
VRFCFANDGRRLKFGKEGKEADEENRLDFEAMAAYLLLPPIGGVLLLMLEHKSDYIR